MMPCLVLDHAEEMLIQAARDEANLTSVFHHVTALVLDAGYAAIIAIAFRDAGRDRAQRDRRGRRDRAPESSRRRQGP